MTTIMTAAELEAFLAEEGRLIVTDLNKDAAAELETRGVVTITSETKQHGSKRGRPGICSQFVTVRKIITRI